MSIMFKWAELVYSIIVVVNSNTGSSLLDFLRYNVPSDLTKWGNEFFINNRTRRNMFVIHELVCVGNYMLANL